MNKKPNIRSQQDKTRVEYSDSIMCVLYHMSLPTIWFRLCCYFQIFEVDKASYVCLNLPIFKKEVGFYKHGTVHYPIRKQKIFIPMQLQLLFSKAICFFVLLRLYV